MNSRDSSQGSHRQQDLPGLHRLSAQEQGRAARPRRRRRIPPVAARHPAGQRHQPEDRRGSRAPRVRRRAVLPRSHSSSRPTRSSAQLTFFRVYSGTLAAGSYIYNSTTGTKERVGRIVRLQADKREEVKKVFAGEIAAAVGLKDTKTSHTLCDESNPIMLEADQVPRAGRISAHRAEDQGRPGEDGYRAQEAFRRRPDLPRHVRPKRLGDDHLRHGRAAPRNHRRPHEARIQRRGRRRQAAGRIPRDYPGTAEAEGKYIKQTGGKGQYGHVKIKMKPLEPVDPEAKVTKNVTREDHFEFINNIKGGVIPQEFIHPVEKGLARRWSAASLPASRW